MKLLKQSLSLLLSCCLVLAAVPDGFATQADQSTAPPPTQAPEPSAVQAAPQTPEQLQQLVAPIALYPDALVAQVLAAATYPDQIVEADRWLQQHGDLKGEQLGKEVDTQPWDPSVKALVEFPSVLANMDKNLSWTSSLGDAYVNQEQDVMNAVQVMRDRAEKAGNLKSTSQEKVSQQGQTIVIEPADPEVVYVPEYNPWLVYGGPIGIWPGWYSYPGLYIGGPGIAFGLGFGIGFFDGFGWGWGHWGYDWRGHGILFDHHGYVSHSRVFANRNHFNRAGGFHGGGGFHSAGGFHGGDARGFGGGQHGFASPHGQSGTHSGAFSGFNHGGVARGFSSRGRSSFGGGFHGGGGGFHGGGHGGGGHR
ncbi:MAG TPA: DUF3300 domain-containing protein [Candidatus Acidoferrales bacterium]|nr:DUF3300 domain-containing protein [Candidatus Acidoferrales bacterium]